MAPGSPTPLYCAPVPRCRPFAPSAVSQTIDALICPRWTLAVEPDATVREDLCVAVQGGNILELLPRERALARYTPTRVHMRPDHVLMPGLVNTHTHAAMSLMRGYADDMPLQAWLREKIWPSEMRFAAPEYVADGVRLAVAEMLRGGITCFADMYFYPQSTAQVAAESGIRLVAGMIALEFPTPWAANAAECISKGLAVHDAVRSEPLVSTMFAPHAPYSVSDATLDRIRQLADQLEVPVQIHLHETAGEIDDAVAEDGRRPIMRLYDLGLINPGLMAVHATQLTTEEIALLARNGCSVIHCPRSNLKLASGACPVAELLAAGANVALGTDGAASNNRMDLWAEMDTAALLGKFVAGDATALPAPTLVEMATINGARALGLDDTIGSLKPGKSADMICVALDEAATSPVHEPVSQLVYAAGREHVTDVWIAGEHLLEAGNLTRMDTAAICDRAGRWASRISLS